MRILRNPLLVIDFDKTVTIKDTIALLAQFGIDHNKKSQPWSYYTQAYLHDYNQHCPNQPNHDSVSQLLHHLNSYKNVELASLTRVSQGKVFQGLTRDMLYEQGKRHQHLLQPDLVSVLSQIPKQFIRVVSVNWSKDWILGFLHELDLSRHQIYSNDLDFQGLHSTGDIIPSILTTGDKQEVIRTFQSSVVYIGDSLGDLEPLVNADVGIILGRDPSLWQAVNQFNLNLHRVDHWLQIKKILQSMVYYN
ncbi:hypothetical protein G6F70_008032 [Rhizopus microsporus]|uniref:HAD-like protein n=1 Tax=Rhizopus microsporus TaxID=58291 RepID=A0A0C7B2W7_RHIZD|nr:hypothetical protein G6F71_008019 [Rhizopus microsporus]KAG1195705.1 hypothetical protein G6F70_008032 [Rhizopus microsporus]KAG1207557.1 hypothetical protein G6F69_007948 [Rhizopus microsporus]KAG1228386.1 hypothetical protein G6F67_007852 [Rhizopus microsporus]KAG1260344.1 hypothetical protein G6F68_007502 [Rhizopus microsporus]